MKSDDLHDGKSLAAALADPLAHRDELQPYYFSALDETCWHTQANSFATRAASWSRRKSRSKKFP